MPAEANSVLDSMLSMEERTVEMAGLAGKVASNTSATVSTGNEVVAEQRRMASFMLHFQKQYMLNQVNHKGSLCQLWLPSPDESKLVTEGKPYSVVGSGDLLALFRCISCKFSFSMDPSKPEKMGVPGRVFLYKKPEVAQNVQEYPEQAYIRKYCAQHCRVQSMIMLPLFRLNQGRENGPIGIVEVVQMDNNMDFLHVYHMMRASMARFGFGTVEEKDMKLVIPEDQITGVPAAEGMQETDAVRVTTVVQRTDAVQKTDQKLGAKTVQPTIGLPLQEQKIPEKKDDNYMKDDNNDTNKRVEHQKDATTKEQQTNNRLLCFDSRWATLNYIIPQRRELTVEDGLPEGAMRLKPRKETVKRKRVSRAAAKKKAQRVNKEKDADEEKTEGKAKQPRVIKHQPEPSLANSPFDDKESLSLSDKVDPSGSGGQDDRMPFMLDDIDAATLDDDAFYLGTGILEFTEEEIARILSDAPPLY